MLASIRRNFRWRGLAEDVVISGGLGFFGDIACQICFENRAIQVTQQKKHGEKVANNGGGGSAFETRRLYAVTAFDTIYIGGFLHFLYQTYPFAAVAMGRWLPQLRSF